MAITKPPVLPAWADAGDKVQPSNAELSVGWPVSSTPPSRQRFNWVLNFVANAVRYFSRRGMPDYDAAETYMTGDRVIGDDGKTYKCLADSTTGLAPSANPAKWERWGFTLGEMASESGLTGTVSFFAGAAAPSGWLKANGAAVSRDSYSALFAAIGTTFGVGDGATTFNLPDLRGEFLRGFDDGRGVDSGRSFGSAQGGSNVNRLLAGPGASGTLGAWWSDQLGTGDGGFDSTTSTVIPSDVPQGGLSTVAATGIQISRGIVRPRNVALLACIKY